MSLRVAKGRQGLPRSKGDPRDVLIYVPETRPKPDPEPGLLTTTRPEVKKCDSLAMTNWGEWNCIGSKYLGGLGGADC